jgi:hypothetical protein
MKKQILGLFISIATVFTTFTAAQCQPVHVTVNQPPSQYQPKRCKRSKLEYACKNLKSMPALADIPAYRGVAPLFISGVEFPNDKAGVLQDFRFCAHEDNRTVATWYQTALTGMGWHVRQLGPSGLQLYASKGGSTCRVSINKSLQPGFATQVIVLHQQGNAHIK